MPDYIKNSSLEELKEKYSGHHGFAFIHNGTTTDASIENAANVLRNQGFTKDFPLLATQIGNAIIFVYESMDGPYFFQRAEHLQFMGAGKVVPLLFFLRDN
jgi:hypothetical protein